MTPEDNDSSLEWQLYALDKNLVITMEMQVNSNPLKCGKPRTGGKLQVKR